MTQAAGLWAACSIAFGHNRRVVLLAAMLLLSAPSDDVKLPVVTGATSDPGDAATDRFRLDLTRVVTFMLGNEGSNRNYGFIGASGGHHHLTHHGGDKVKIERVKTINRWTLTEATRFLQQEFPNQGVELDESTDLLGEWFIDSMGIIETVLFLEKGFGIEVRRADINGDNFRNVSTLADFISARLD